MGGHCGDKSGASTAAIASYNADHDAHVEIHQVKYLNNIVEQDHRVIKCMVRAMGFKAFRSAAITIAGARCTRHHRKCRRARPDPHRIVRPG
jgi:putative transposase